MKGRTVRWMMSLTRPVSRNGGTSGPGRLTILRQHRVYSEIERPLYRLGVVERVFQEQIDFLVDHGLTPVTVSEGLRHLASRAPGHRVAMTFDDGYADNVERALPVLAEAGARATFYLTAGLMEERRAPWWDELAHALETTAHDRVVWSVPSAGFDLPLHDWRERQSALRHLLDTFRVPPLERSVRLSSLRAALGVTEPVPCELASWDQAARLVEAGMEIGAHTLTHPHLTVLDAAAQEREITGSADRIEERLGVRPQGFAYPGGDYDRRTLAAVQVARFRHAVTTDPGDNRAGADVLELKRRGFGEGNCLGPGGRFSSRLALAELDGAFDTMRAAAAAPEGS